MNKKTIISIIIIIVFVIAIVLAIFVPKNSNNAKNAKTKIEGQPTSDSENFNLVSIESTAKNPIEKENVVVEKMQITKIGEQLEIKTILKNNSDSEMNGYYIEIDLLDEQGNVVTTIADNSRDKIAPNSSKEVINSVVGLENPEKITSARISELQKISAGEFLNEQLQTPDLAIEEMPKVTDTMGPKQQEQ